jgi:hypothetical protein
MHRLVIASTPCHCRYRSSSGSWPPGYRWGDLVIAVEVLQAAGFVGYPLTHDPATVDSSNGDQPTRRDATANRQHLDSATRHGEPKGPRHEGHRDHRLPADAYTILPKRSSDDVQERVAPRRSPTPSPQTPIESLAERQI